MKRVACVWLPMWPIDLARRRSGAPRDRREILLMAIKANQQLVAACCGLSLRAGVRLGMTVAHARALLKNPVILDADPYRDRRALERLARWMMRFSPFIAIDPTHQQHEAEPDCLLLDVTGCERLFGGEQCLVGLIASGLTGLRLHYRIGVGPNIAAAWAAAHCGDEVVKVVGEGGTITMRGRSGRKKEHDPKTGSCHPGLELTEFFSPLPIAALRLPEDVHHSLTELGIDKVADLLKLPRSALPSRFGGILLKRIDQAFGRIPESFTPIVLEPPLVVEQMLEGPTTNPEAIEVVTRELLVTLAQELSRRESGVTCLALQMDRLKEDCRGVEGVEERLTLSRPSRNAKHLWTLLRPRVERVHLGNGIERIVLIAKRQRRVRHRQLTREDQTAHRSGKPGVSASDESLSQSTGELVDTLVNRLGESRVLRPVPQASHLPERVAAYEQVVSQGDQAGDRERERLFQKQAKQLRLSTPFWSIPPRPSVLFEMPHLVQVMAMVPDRPPSRMTWQGSELTMIRGIGPERLAEEWWQTRAGSHDNESYDGLGSASGSRRAGLSAGRAGVTNLTNQQLVQVIVAPAPASTIFRDYYRIQDTSGRWFWVYRESESTRWYLHGIWA